MTCDDCKQGEDCIGSPGEDLRMHLQNDDEDDMCFVCGDLYCVSCWNFYQDIATGLGMQPLICLEISRVVFRSVTNTENTGR